MGIKKITGFVATGALGALVILHDLGVESYERNLDSIFDLLRAFDFSSCSLSNFCWSIGTLYLAFLALSVCAVIWLFLFVRWAFRFTRTYFGDSSQQDTILHEPKFLQPSLTTEFLQAGMSFFIQGSVRTVLVYANLHLKNSGAATTATNFEFYMLCGEEKFSLSWWQPTEDLTLDENLTIRAERLLLNHRGNYDVPQTKLLNQGDSEHGWICIRAPIKNIERIYELIKSNTELIYVIEYEDTLNQKTIKKHSVDRSQLDLMVEVFESEWYSKTDEEVKAHYQTNRNTQDATIIGNPEEYTVATQKYAETGLTAQFRQVGIASFLEDDKNHLMVYTNFYIRNSGPPSKAMDFKFYILCDQQKFFFDWFQPDEDMKLSDDLTIRTNKLLLKHVEKYDVPETRIIKKGDSVLGWIVMYAPVSRLITLYEAIKKSPEMLLIVMFHDLNGVATVMHTHQCETIRRGVIDLVESDEIVNKQKET